MQNDARLYTGGNIDSVKLLSIRKKGNVPRSIAIIIPKDIYVSLPVTVFIFKEQPMLKETFYKVIAKVDKIK